MSSTFLYRLPVEQTQWKVEGQTTTAFTWEYEDGSEDLLRLYGKGKKQQWDAADRLDWSQEVDPDNPMGMSDRTIAIHGTDLWNSLGEKDRVHIRRNLQAHSLSQFMHGEQGALIATAKIVQTVPDLRVEVLRRDPGDGRGAPRGGLLARCSTRSSSSRTRSPRRWPSCSRPRSPTGAGT